MAIRRVRTSDYSQEARDRLGEAVTRAREAMGYKFRPAFARDAKVSLRSLAAIENGESGVGATNLRAVARALPNWTEDTPRVILERGPIPPTAAEQPPEPEHSPAEELARIEPRDDYERKVLTEPKYKRARPEVKLLVIRRHRELLEQSERELQELLAESTQDHSKSATARNESDTRDDPR